MCRRDDRYELMNSVVVLEGLQKYVTHYLFSLQIPHEPWPIVQ